MIRGGRGLTIPLDTSAETAFNGSSLRRQDYKVPNSDATVPRCLTTTSFQPRMNGASKMMRKRSLVIIVLSGVLGLPVPSPAWAALKKVWALSDGHKIESDDLGNPLQNTNAVWRQNAVQLLAARNEIVAFQLIIASDPGGIRALEVRLP